MITVGRSVFCRIRGLRGARVLRIGNARRSQSEGVRSPAEPVSPGHILVQCDASRRIRAAGPIRLTSRTDPPLTWAILAGATTPDLRAASSLARAAAFSAARCSNEYRRTSGFMAVTSCAVSMPRTLGPINARLSSDELLAPPPGRFWRRRLAQVWCPSQADRIGACRGCHYSALSRSMGMLVREGHEPAMPMVPERDGHAPRSRRAARPIATAAPSRPARETPSRPGRHLHSRR